MPNDKLHGVCPNCGPAEIRVLVEGSWQFTGESGWEYGIALVGRCCGCLAFLHTPEWATGKADMMTWNLLDGDDVAFLLPELGRNT
jgi:hypothetical protein